MASTMTSTDDDSSASVRSMSHGQGKYLRNAYKQTVTKLMDPVCQARIGQQGSQMHGTAANTTAAVTRVYSPVTLNNEWPKLERLLFMLFFSCLGSTMNGFFVAAFFVEHTLNKAGNVFLACIGMADLMITTAVMPVASVVLLSGEWDVLPVCLALHFLTETSTYCYSLFFSLVAAETYYRLCRTPAEYEVFISMRIGLVAFLVFAVSFCFSGVGVFLHLDYDYCERKHYGNFYYRVSTTVIFHAVPFIMTLLGLIVSANRIRRRAREQTQYKRSQQYERDSTTTNVHIVAFLIYAIAWVPYLVVVHEFPGASDSKFYHCVLIGVCRSVFTSFLYSIANRNFRRAFAHLFNYCCCKSTLSSSFTNRHRRALDYKPATDVRVHIMHQAVNACNPQRAAAAARETQEL